MCCIVSRSITTASDANHGATKTAKLRTTYPTDDIVVNEDDTAPVGAATDQMGRAGGSQSVSVVTQVTKFVFKSSHDVYDRAGLCRHLLNDQLVLWRAL